MSSTDSMKKSAKVYFRILPRPNMAWDYVKISRCGTKVRVRHLQDFNRKKGLKNKVNYRLYYADGVFINEGQSDIYEIVMENVLSSVFSGNSGVILCYGQTGTGKTLTLSGLRNSFEDRGITARILPDLFKHKETQGRSISTAIHMSYIEIHKAGVTDLLKPLPNCLDINSLKQVSAVNLSNEDEGLMHLFIAEARKQYNYAAQYPSNVATNILTFIITKRNTSVVNAVRKVSKIHLVDFAGVDTAGKLSCLHKNVIDIGKANTLKSQLEQFVMILSADVPEHIKVKQRLNVFIQYLGKCLSANSIFRAIGHITADFEDLMMTHSMLRFGQLLLGIKYHSRETEDDELTSLENSLKELQDLKHEKIYEAIFMNNDLSMNINQDRLSHLKGVVEEYVQNKTNTITVLNVADANIVLKVFKDFTKEALEKNDMFCKQEYERGFNDAITIRQKRPTKSESARTSGINVHRVRSIDSRRRDISKTDMTADEIKERRKSRTSSISTLVKKSSKPKTTSESSILERNVSRSKVTLESLGLPESVPFDEEAWEAYTKKENSEYTKLTHLIKENEKAAKQVQQTYLQEVASLQALIELCDIRKEELLQAKMIRKYTEKVEVTEEGTELLSENEKICLENKRIAEDKVCDQQEIVLRNQAELRAFLNQRAELKKALQQNFDEYCRNTYSLPVPPAVQESRDVLDDLLLKMEEECELELQEQEAESALAIQAEAAKIKYEKYRSYMYRELKNIGFLKTKHRAWFN